LSRIESEEFTPAQFFPVQLNSAQSAYPDCRQSNKHAAASTCQENRRHRSLSRIESEEFIPAQFFPVQLNSALSVYPDCRQSNKHCNSIDMSGKQAASLLEQG